MYSESHKISLNIADFFLKNNSNVLDIGCSTGFFLNELYKKNIKKKINCYGVDNTKSMISFCKKKDLKKLNFTIMTI